MASSDDHDVVRTRLDAIARSVATSGEESRDSSDDYRDHRYGGSGYDADGYGDEPDIPPARLVDRIAAARWGTGRGGTAALAGVGVLAALVAVGVVWSDRPVPEAVPPLPSVEVVAASTTRPEPEAGPVESAESVVSVVGLVVRPGLVHLRPGARVADALEAAGGAAPGADLVGLNLARRVADGDQIVVGMSPPQPIPHGSTVSGAGGAAADPVGGPGRIDLNAADESALDALPGVGPVTAAAIVAWRDAHGPFADVEQLGEVDGIGPARLARLRELVTV